MKRKAVFIDRDNTLIEDPGYIHKPEDVKLLNGVPEGLKKLRSAGFLLIVVSNQSGIGRGYYGEEDFHAVNRKLQELLLPYGVWIDAFYFCPHKPGDGCSCRKPGTGMVERAAKEWNIDVTKSYVVGDKDSDVELALRAGCKCGIKVGVPPFETLFEAALHILRLERWG